MSSFFEFMKRMVEGKPVFDDKNDSGVPRGYNEPAAQSEVPSVPTGPVIRKGDASSFPVVAVKQVKTSMNGNKVEVYCRIASTWPAQIMLDKIRIFNTTRELDTYLRPNEEREFLVYSGPKLMQQYPDAEIDYKTQQEGDYFRAVHDVAFAYNSTDKTYTVNDVRLQSPIRDIYG